MGRSSALGIGIAAALLGCATVVTRDADLSKAPKGVRIYPPRACLFVDGGANDGEGATVLAYLPDFDRAYDVKPLTILAQQDLEIELEAGQLRRFGVSQDAIALVGLVREARLAAKAAGVGVSTSAPLRGTFGFGDGVHCLTDDGRFD